MGLPYGDETYRIIGACFEVYNEKGCGFLEAVYQECLEIELGIQNIPFRPQPELTLAYKGRDLKKKYQPDFICFDKIIVEIKAVSAIVDEHRAQLINYLNATEMEIGLLINFGHYPKLEFLRYANLPDHQRKERCVREAPVEYSTNSSSHPCQSV